MREPNDYECRRAPQLSSHVRGHEFAAQRFVKQKPFRPGMCFGGVLDLLVRPSLFFFGAEPHFWIWLPEKNY